MSWLVVYTKSRQEAVAEQNLRNQGFDTLLPRLTQQSGFDWGSGFYVNPTPPEDAARFLREALALQEAS